MEQFQKLKKYIFNLNDLKLKLSKWYSLKLKIELLTIRFQLFHFLSFNFAVKFEIVESITNDEAFGYFFFIYGELRNSLYINNL